jgi:dUTP pyrophosphatase
METILKFKKLISEAVIPQFATVGDVGFDLFCLEEKTLAPGERYLFKIGLASEIPENHFVVIKPRSGLAVKAGIDVLAGVIDAGYRGEWGVVLINLGKENYTFFKGDKIAQGLLLRFNQPEIVEVNSLSEAERGEKGFGSSGN